MKLKTKLSKLRHDGYITDAEYAIIINVLNKFSTQPCKNWHDVPSDEMTLEQARQAVKDLRKKLAEYLEQQPKTGRWIKVTNGRGGHECDLCHEYAPSYQSGKEYLTKYCPNCGAKMEVANDE